MLQEFYLNKNLLLLTKLSNLKINSLNNFSLLKQNLENDSISYSYLSNFNNLLSLRSTIYFSKSLKELRSCFLTFVESLLDHYMYNLICLLLLFHF